MMHGQKNIKIYIPLAKIQYFQKGTCLYCPGAWDSVVVKALRY